MPCRAPTCLMLLAALLQGCPNCPPALVGPSARLVGQAGGASAAAFAKAEYVTGLAWREDGTLWVQARELYGFGDGYTGLSVYDPASGARRRQGEAGGEDDRIAAAPGGKLWHAGALTLERLDAGGTPDGFALDLPATDAAMPDAVVDDGASGAYYAAYPGVWHADGLGRRHKLADLPGQRVKGLARWGGGALALMAGHNARPDEATTPAPTMLYEVSENGVQPWAHADQLKTPLAIAAAPDGSVVAVDGGDPGSPLDVGIYRSDPYRTALVRVTPAGKREELLHSEADMQPLAGYRVLTTCARIEEADDFGVSALAVAADGRVATLFTRRQQLVVWHP